MKVFLRKTGVSWRLRGLLLTKTSKKANSLSTLYFLFDSNPYVRVLGIDVTVKGNIILFTLKYAESVIDILSIELNLGALVVLYPILLVMPHEKVG